MAGGIQVEIQNAEGKALPGYSLADCPEIFGDELNRVVQWRTGSDEQSLAGKTPTMENFINAALIAVKDVKPLSQNEYKKALLKGAIQTALHNCITI